MFYKILAVLMIFSSALGAKEITNCNAFGADPKTCEEVYEVENFEIIEEVSYTKENKKPVTKTKSRPIFGGRCKANDPDCGPIFKRNEGCDNCKEEVVQEETVYVKNYTPVVDLNYDNIHRQCNNFAPINFAHVDFRLEDKGKFANYVNKLGDYRFRIFGCRRNDKEMFLNVGRTMQKDMNFFDIFDKVYGDCMPQQQMPSDLCNPNSNSLMPEYILTAEIVDYAMNVCDEFDWQKSENKEARSGSSEMTVVWRLMDVARQKVFWKGSSTGYAVLEKGDVNGEVVLVEEAFEDALIQLRYLDGFEKQISTRHSPEAMYEYRKDLAELERQINPAKCDYQEAIVATACPKCAPCSCEEESVVATVVEDERVCNSENGCGPIFERNKGKCGDNDDCGPIFKRNEGCDSLSCKWFGDEEEVVEIDEASGVDIFGNVDTVRYVEKEWIDIPITEEQQKIVETSFMESKGNFCIENELVNKDMNPFNVYKTRASIVDISSLSGKKKGVGLIINDQFILTSADMISKDENDFNVKTINGVEFKANGFRFSPSKNVALLLTKESIKYTPLPLNLELPPVGKSGFMTLGMNLHKDGGEGYVDNTTTIAGYRFSEDKGAEIITNQHTQNLTVGGALVDDKGNIYGIAHYGKRYSDEPDMYMPIEEALKSLDVELCGRDFLNQKPWQKTNVETKRFKAPEEMLEKERK